MKKIWEQKHDTSLSDRLHSELSGQHEKLIIHLLGHGRGDGPRDEALAIRKSEEIHRQIKEGKTMLGGLSDKAEREIGRILASISPDQINDVKAAFDRNHGKDGSLKSVLAKRLSGGNLLSPLN